MSLWADITASIRASVNRISESLRPLPQRLTSQRDVVNRARCISRIRMRFNRRNTPPAPPFSNAVNCATKVWERRKRCNQLRNLSMRPGRSAILPGKVWSTAGSESCVGLGSPALRSVDSEPRSRVIEPRNGWNCERLCLLTSGDSISTVVIDLDRGELAGVRERGRSVSGTSRNVGGPLASAVDPGGEPGDQLQAGVSAFRDVRSEAETQLRYR